MSKTVHTQGCFTWNLHSNVYIYHIYIDIDIDIFLDIPFKKQIQVEFLFDEHGISMNQRENDEQRKKHKKCPLGKARDLNDWPIS